MKHTVFRNSDKSYLRGLITQDNELFCLSLNKSSKNWDAYDNEDESANSIIFAYTNIRICFRTIR